MIDIRVRNNLIFNEFSEDERTNFFDMKEKKFLHNIDTFYYSVKLVNDFTVETQDKNCLKLRDFFNKIIDRSVINNVVPLNIPGCDYQLNVRNFHYAGFYNICVECPELFDIFIADTVPVGANGYESVTSEIIVQLRSCLLWQYGATKSFEYSYEAVKAICEFFNLSILEVKENRIDYCWHTNYLQDPEKFLRIDNFARMQVSRYKRIRYEYEFKPNQEYENDYIALGKRGDKCFVRIYLKSKEVVEKGYKPWFFKEWLLNGLINRYDFYVFEKAYLKQSWNYIDLARLEFYREYGSDSAYVDECNSIITGELNKDADYIAALADKLTPRVTQIINVEFQTMRRMSKSFELKFTKDNEDKNECRRIYDYLDNRAMITEYLTYSTLRLIDPSTDSNRSRADYCSFWKALRSCKMIDVKKSPKDLKLTRNYTRQLNKDIVKKRMVNSAITYSLYDKGINDDHVVQDAAEVLLMLNDNDVYELKKQKQRKITELNNMLYQEPLPGKRKRNITVIDNNTGEVF